MRFELRFRCRAARITIAAALMALTTGCGGKPIYPVKGQIVDATGTPVTELEGGSVDFESTEGNVSSSGPIDSEARFVLTTERPGDGAHVGKNRVSILRPYFNPEMPKPRVILPKYDSLDTSGVEVDVEPKQNDVTLTVERVKGKGRAP
jgi:hypothetical protein